MDSFLCTDLFRTGAGRAFIREPLPLPNRNSFGRLVYHRSDFNMVSQIVYDPWVVLNFENRFYLLAYEHWGGPFFRCSACVESIYLVRALPSNGFRTFAAIAWARFLLHWSKFTRNPQWDILGRTVQPSIYHVVQQAFSEFECAALSESIQSHLGQSYGYQGETALAGPTDIHPAKVLVIIPQGPAEPGDEAAVRAAISDAVRNFGTVSGEATITLLRMPDGAVLEHLCRVADVTGFADCESDE
jgi:hypothetical protein